MQIMSYFVFTEECDLIIPVCDCPLPVYVSQSDTLLVDVQILTNSKSENNLIHFRNQATIVEKDLFTFLQSAQS